MSNKEVNAMIVEKRKNFIINVIYFALIIAIGYIAIKYALGLLMPFVIGFIVALLLKPVINFVSEKWRIHKKAAAVILILLFYGAAGFSLSWIGVRLVMALKDGIVQLPEMYSTNIEPAIYELFDNAEKLIERLDPLMVQAIKDMAASLSQSVGSVVSNISSKAIEFISSAVSFMPGLFLSIVFAVISSLFFAMDYNKITGYIARLFPAKNRNLLIELKDFATGLGLKYVKAYALLMAVTFAELALGLSLLRVDGAIGVAALIAVIDLLPVLGTGGVIVPWIIIELIKGNMPFAVGLGALYLIITVVRNILEPKLVGKQIGLHPLVMLICVYVGLKLFGFIGLFVLPVAVVIAKHLYDNDKIHFGGNNRS
jgi:sporulation integral membrane protein YtvI